MLLTRAPCDCPLMAASGSGASLTAPAAGVAGLDRARPGMSSWPDTRKESRCKFLRTWRTLLTKAACCCRLWQLRGLALHWLRLLLVRLLACA